MTADTKISQRMNRPLAEVDPEIADALREEGRRQGTGLELIPSENFVSEAVLEAAGAGPPKKKWGGLSGRPLLRRMRIRGSRRAAGDRSRQGALWRGTRECAIAFRNASECFRLH